MVIYNGWWKYVVKCNVGYKEPSVSTHNEEVKQFCLTGTKHCNLCSAKASINSNRARQIAHWNRTSRCSICCHTNKISRPITNKLRSRSIISVSAYGWVGRLDVHHIYVLKFKGALVPYNKQQIYPYHASLNRKLSFLVIFLERKEHGNIESFYFVVAIHNFRTFTPIANLKNLTMVI